jgi:hypothetical protein
MPLTVASRGWEDTRTALVEEVSGDIAVGQDSVAAASAAVEASAVVVASAVEASAMREVSVAADSMEAVEGAVSMEVAAEVTVRVSVGWIAPEGQERLPWTWSNPAPVPRRSPVDVLAAWIFESARIAELAPGVLEVPPFCLSLCCSQ